MLRLFYSLGSTRFFKVARARHPGGLMVVKVFTIQDQGVNLSNDQDKISAIKKLLDGCPNCLSFQYAIVSFDCLEILRIVQVL